MQNMPVQIMSYVAPSRSPIGVRRAYGAVVCGLEITGGVLLAYTNGAMFALVSTAFLSVALWTLTRAFRKEEARAVVLAFGACICVGGLCQMYSLFVFGRVQTTIDAQTFFDLSRDGSLSMVALQELTGKINAPLAVAIWRVVYWAADGLGFPSGPWLGVLVNALCVAGAAGVGVSAVRQVFGDDRKRLIRAGSMFAATGMYWLFGALFLRDCFLLLLTALVMRVCLENLRSPRFWNTARLAAVVAGTQICFSYLRGESSFFTYLILAALILCHLLGRGVARAVLVCVSGCLLVAGLKFGAFSELTVLTAAAVHRTGSYYAGLSAIESGNGLGYSLIVSQPLYIRSIAGSASILLSPIPLWQGFRVGAWEYDWIKSYHGFFMAAIMPFVAFGALETVKRVWNRGTHARQLLFLLLVAVAGLVAVAVTSLETRHFGPFLPFLLILSLAYNPRRLSNRRTLANVAVAWGLVVVAVHVSWFILKAQ